MNIVSKCLRAGPPPPATSQRWCLLCACLHVLLTRDYDHRIQESLLHALNANSSDWPAIIQSYALSLLRSGEITTFPALLRRVLDDVREDTTLNPAGRPKNGTKANGDGKLNGAPPVTSDSSSNRPNLALPEAVVAEALKVTRESLEAVCEIGDD